MLDIPKHRQILFDLITDVYSSNVGSVLGFKGDTYFYFFEELDRFSTDLDFDLLYPDKLEDVKNTIRTILEKYGDIDEEYNKRYTMFFLLNYEKGSVNVKVEINKRQYPSFSYEYKNFYGTNVLALNIKDAIATKFIAATKRKKLAMRDFYDIHFFLEKGMLPNTKIVEEQTGKSFNKYIKYLILYIEKEITKRNVLTGLGEILDEKKKDWVKQNLKENLIQRLSFLIDNISKSS